MPLLWLAMNNYVEWLGSSLWKYYLLTFQTSQVFKNQSNLSHQLPWIIGISLTQWDPPREKLRRFMGLSREHSYVRVLENMNIGKTRSISSLVLLNAYRCEIWSFNEQLRSWIGSNIKHLFNLIFSPTPAAWLAILVYRLYWYTCNNKNPQEEQTNLHRLCWRKRVGA